MNLSTLCLKTDKLISIFCPNRIHGVLYGGTRYDIVNIQRTVNLLRAKYTCQK